MDRHNIRDLLARARVIVVTHTATTMATAIVQVGDAGGRTGGGNRIVRVA